DRPEPPTSRTCSPPRYERTQPVDRPRGGVDPTPARGAPSRSDQLRPRIQAIGAEPTRRLLPRGAAGGRVRRGPASAFPPPIRLPPRDGTPIRFTGPLPRRDHRPVLGSAHCPAGGDRGDVRRSSGRWAGYGRPQAPRFGAG